jgi:hypothetical protein
MSTEYEGSGWGVGGRGKRGLRGQRRGLGRGGGGTQARPGHPVLMKSKLKQDPDS